MGSETRASLNPSRSFKVGGEGWIRTTEGISQQIYSLPRLATSVPLHCIICLGNLEISKADGIAILANVTFCVTVWLLRELKPDESDNKDSDEPGVPIEIEVDRRSLPISSVTSRHKHIRKAKYLHGFAWEARLFVSPRIPTRKRPPNCGCPTSRPRNGKGLNGQTRRSPMSKRSARHSTCWSGASTMP